MAKPFQFNYKYNQTLRLKAFNNNKIFDQKTEYANMVGYSSIGSAIGSNDFKYADDFNKAFAEYAEAVKQKFK